LFAREREFDDIVTAIEEEEQFRREKLSCPNATVSPAQDLLAGYIRKGEYEPALAMLDADPKLAKACDREGGTPLHVACEAAALPVIDWLLKHHANARKLNLKGCAPLEAAVVNVNWRDRARCASFAEVARRLLLHGAPISPLVAAALGDIDELTDLDKRDPKSVREAHLKDRLGVLSAAVVYGQPEALTWLLSVGVDVNERHRVANLEEEVITQGQPLWLAAAFGEYDMARILLEHGADPNAQVYASGTPVSRAFGAMDENMKALLAEFGGKPDPYVIGVHRDIGASNAFLNSEPSEDAAADLVWGAACGGSPEIVEMAIGKLNWPASDSRWFRFLGAPLSLANHAPHSVHPEAFDRGTYPECLRVILRHGVDVNIVGRKGETLMHCIISKGKIWGRDVMTDEERLQFAQIVLEASPDLTIRDSLLNSTPLGWACRWGRADVVRMLLEHGAKVDEPDAEPWAAPLAWARKMGYPDITDLLRNALAPKPT
jgi:ankyrin repeat protein